MKGFRVGGQGHGSAFREAAEVPSASQTVRLRASICGSREAGVPKWPVLCAIQCPQGRRCCEMQLLFLSEVPDGKSLLRNFRNAEIFQYRYTIFQESFN